MITVADYVVDFFHKIGSKYVFTVSGGGSIFLCDSLHRSKKLSIYLVITNKLFHFQQRVMQDKMMI